MTTVADIVAQYLKMPQDLEVLVPEDPDGHTFRGVDGTGIRFVERSSENSHEVFDEDDLSDEDPDDIDRMFRRVVVIYPI